MTNPLFPIHFNRTGADDAVHVIEPYRYEQAWVFDDPAVGLQHEPFVAGIDAMIERLTSGIPDATSRFRLLFAAHPFDGYQTSLTWIRADSVEGHWYRADDAGDEGWLCPALFFYFQSPPKKIFVRAEPQPT